MAIAWALFVEQVILAAGLVLTGYAVALLLAASQTTTRRDVT